MPPSTTSTHPHCFPGQLVLKTGIWTNQVLLPKKEGCKHYYLCCLNSTVIFLPLPKTVWRSLQRDILPESHGEVWKHNQGQEVGSQTNSLQLQMHLECPSSFTISVDTHVFWKSALVLTTAFGPVPHVLLYVLWKLACLVTLHDEDGLAQILTAVRLFTRWISFTELQNARSRKASPEII